MCRGMRHEAYAPCQKLNLMTHAQALVSLLLAQYQFQGKQWALYHQPVLAAT